MVRDIQIDNTISRALTGLLFSALLSGCVTQRARTASPEREDACQLTSAVTIPKFNDATKAALRVKLEDMVDRGFAPGVQMIVKQKGETVFSYTYGFADREDQRKLGEDAMFRIYSMTKPITSIVTLQLVDEGKISLDDPVADYVSEFAKAKVFDPSGEPVSVKRDVTIRDLLTHQAGIIYGVQAKTSVGSGYSAAGIPAGPLFAPPPRDGRSKVGSLAEMAHRIATIPLANQPGEKFTYGNALDVLGRVIEIATGKPLADVFRDRIFIPLKMEDTGFYVAADKAKRLTSAYIEPVQFKKQYPGVMNAAPTELLQPSHQTKTDDDSSSVFLLQPSIPFGGAGLVSTAKDYLRFTEAVKRDVRESSAILVSRASAAAMAGNRLTQSSMAEAQMLEGLGFGYGFAVKVKETAAAPTFPQCGMFWSGFGSTYFWIDPAGDTSGVMMTQVFRGNVKSYWHEIMEELYTP